MRSDGSHIPDLQPIMGFGAKHQEAPAKMFSLRCAVLLLIAGVFQAHPELDLLLLHVVAVDCRALWL